MNLQNLREKKKKINIQIVSEHMIQCKNSHESDQGVIQVAELLDTVFIVARKRPLLFLHWYHHISVLVYTWHAYKDHTASGKKIDL